MSSYDHKFHAQQIISKLNAYELFARSCTCNSLYLSMELAEYGIVCYFLLILGIDGFVSLFLNKFFWFSCVSCSISISIIYILFNLIHLANVHAIFPHQICNQNNVIQSFNSLRLIIGNFIVRFFFANQFSKWHFFSRYFCHNKNLFFFFSL